MPRPANVSRVHITPYWPANPYQPLLVDELRRLGFDIRTGTALKALRTSAPAAQPTELVHLHWLPVAGASPPRLIRWGLFARRLARLRQWGIPVVWTAHNVVPHESGLAALDLWLSRTVARHASRIICHSAAARRELMSRLRIEDGDKVRVIPHGNYIESYGNARARDNCRGVLDLPADVTVFLLLGAIRPYKGVLELVDSFRRLSATDARLLIVGKPQNDAIDAEVRARTAPDPRIKYVPGRVADEDLQIYFNAADAAVFPYRESLTSGALVLAMSFGRACIAPRLSGMVDCLGERGGVLYDAGREDGLYRALAEAMEQRERLGEMGAINLEVARSWDWKSIAAATAECYGEAAEVAASAIAASPQYVAVRRM